MLVPACVCGVCVSVCVCVRVCVSVCFAISVVLAFLPFVVGCGDGLVRISIEVEAPREGGRRKEEGRKEEGGGRKEEGGPSSFLPPLLLEHDVPCSL